MCCAQALQVLTFIFATLITAETTPELSDLQFEHASAEGITDSYPRTSKFGSSISREDGLQDVGRIGGLDPALETSQMNSLEQLEKLTRQSITDTAQETSPSSLAMDQQFVSTAPQSNYLSTLQSSSGQEQVKGESQLGAELKQTSRVAALLAQDAALLAKELVAMNSVLRGAQGFNPHISAHASELQAPKLQTSELQASELQAPDLHASELQVKVNSPTAWQTETLHTNLADISNAAMGASRDDASNSSSGPRCGGKDQVACDSTIAYFTMNYRVPLWLGVILWVLIWVCIICFCVGLCINIFKPNVLRQ